MAAPATPVHPSVAAAGVQPGDFIGVQYHVAGGALIHERVVVLVPPGLPGEYEELYVGSPDVL
eukprot:9138399-Pyramimonas_sp.AAC.1